LRIFLLHALTGLLSLLRGLLEGLLSVSVLLGIDATGQLEDLARELLLLLLQVFELLALLFAQGAILLERLACALELLGSLRLLARGAARRTLLHLLLRALHRLTRFLDAGLCGTLLLRAELTFSGRLLHVAGQLLGLTLELLLRGLRLRAAGLGRGSHLLELLLQVLPRPVERLAGLRAPLLSLSETLLPLLLLLRALLRGLLPLRLLPLRLLPLRLLAAALRLLALRLLALRLLALRLLLRRLLARRLLARLRLREALGFSGGLLGGAQLLLGLLELRRGFERLLILAGFVLKLARELAAPVAHAPRLRARARAAGALFLRGGHQLAQRLLRCGLGAALGRLRILRVATPSHRLGTFVEALGGLLEVLRSLALLGGRELGALLTGGLVGQPRCLAVAGFGFGALCGRELPHGLSGLVKLLGDGLVIRGRLKVLGALRKLLGGAFERCGTLLLALGRLAAAPSRARGSALGSLLELLGELIERLGHAATLLARRAGAAAALGGLLEFLGDLAALPRLLHGQQSLANVIDELVEARRLLARVPLLLLLKRLLQALVLLL
jgi:hypothetical protein